MSESVEPLWAWNAENGSLAELSNVELVGTLASSTRFTNRLGGRPTGVRVQVSLARGQYLLEAQGEFSDIITFSVGRPGSEPLACGKAFAGGRLAVPFFIGEGGAQMLSMIAHGDHAAELQFSSIAVRHIGSAPSRHIGMATFPARIETAPTVIESLSEQCDQLSVYLNKTGSSVRYPSRDNIEYFLGSNTGDVRDNGKFYALIDTGDEFFLSVDDDILYPSDYVDVMFGHSTFMGHTLPVCVHGNFFKANAREYFQRYAAHFTHHLPTHFPVHAPGTGTLAFMRNAFDLSYGELGTPGAVDMWVGQALRRRSLAAVCIPRPANWLKALGHDGGEDLYAEAKKGGIAHDLLLSLLPAGTQPVRRAFSRSGLKAPEVDGFLRTVGQIERGLKPRAVDRAAAMPLIKALRASDLDDDRSAKAERDENVSAESTLEKILKAKAYRAHREIADSALVSLERRHGPTNARVVLSRCLISLQEGRSEDAWHSYLLLTRTLNKHRARLLSDAALALAEDASPPQNSNLLGTIVWSAADGDDDAAKRPTLALTTQFGARQIEDLPTQNILGLFGAENTELATAFLWNRKRHRTPFLELVNAINGRVRMGSLGWNGHASGPFAFHRTAEKSPIDLHGPLVSIIVCAYQPDDLFELAIQSILAQSYKAIEVIVVDDCSTPPVDLRHIQDPRLSVVRAPANGGPYVSRNLGLRKASGAFVTFHDADDWMHPDKISTQVLELEHHPEVYAHYGRHFRIGRDNSLALENHLQILGDGPITGMFRRSLFDRIGEFKLVRTRGDIEFRRRVSSALGRRAVLDHPGIMVIATHARSSNSFAMRNGLEKATELEAFRSLFAREHEMLSHQVK